LKISLRHLVSTTALAAIMALGVASAGGAALVDELNGLVQERPQLRSVRDGVAGFQVDGEISILVD
jgi:hypothetical protein